MSLVIGGRLFLNLFVYKRCALELNKSLLFLLFFSLLFSFRACAESSSPVAFDGLDFGKTSHVVKRELLPEHELIIEYFSQGFIVRSMQNGILAYSNRSSLNRKETLKTFWPLLEQLSPAKRSIKKLFHQQWPAKGSTIYDGWIQTAWHQRSPFNQHCPIDPLSGQRSLAGCVSIAIGQLLPLLQNFSPPSLSDSDHYQTLTRKIKIDADAEKLDFVKFDQLNQKIETISDKINSGMIVSHLEIAWLLFYLGILSETDYTSELSSSGANLKTLLHEIGYPTARLEHELDSNTLQEIKQNIMNGSPVVLVIPGHAVIADGYDTGGFYHLNYGWGEQEPQALQEAWFRLDNGSEPIILDVVYDIAQTESPLILDKEQIEMAVFAPGEAGDSSLILTNPYDSPQRIDHVRVEPPFTVSWDGEDFADSVGSAIVHPFQSLPLNLRYAPQNHDSVFSDLLISCNDGSFFLCPLLKGSLQPVRGTRVLAGTVSGTWKKEHSPYNVFGSIQVAQQERLIIEPGVEIVFWNGGSLVVKGDAQLLARGAPADSIRFYPAKPDQPWQGINFFASYEDDSLTYCVIRHAHSQDWGGGLWISDTLPFFRGCRVSDNTARYGGGMYLWKAKPVIKNTLIVHNRAHYGGAVYADVHSHPQFFNVTVADNQAASGSLVYASMGNSITFKNSILWNNFADDSVAVSLSSKDVLSFDFACIDTSNHIDWRFPIHLDVVYKGENLFSDPDFLAGYHLAPDSPCIDAGDPDPKFNDPPDPLDTELAAFPALRSVRNDLGVFGGGAEEGALPTGIRTKTIIANKGLGAFPNPFTSLVNLEFEIVKRCHVRLDIYNVRGQIIETLLDKPMGLGKYRIQWSSGNHPVGPYFVRLKHQKAECIKILHLE